MLLVNISYCNKCMLIHTYSFYKSIKSIEGYVRPFDYSNIPFKMIPGNTRKKMSPFNFTLRLVVQIEFKRNIIDMFELLKRHPLILISNYLHSYFQEDCTCFTATATVDYFKMRAP